jgi:hypothetical protein
MAAETYGMLELFIWSCILYTSLKGLNDPEKAMMLPPNKMQFFKWLQWLFWAGFGVL